MSFLVNLKHYQWIQIQQILKDFHHKTLSWAKTAKNWNRKTQRYLLSASYRHSPPTTQSDRGPFPSAWSPVPQGRILPKAHEQNWRKAGHGASLSLPWWKRMWVEEGSPCEGARHQGKVAAMNLEYSAHPLTALHTLGCLFWDKVYLCSPDRTWTFSVPTTASQAGSMRKHDQTRDKCIHSNCRYM